MREIGGVYGPTIGVSWQPKWLNQIQFDSLIVKKRINCIPKMVARMRVTACVRIHKGYHWLNLQSTTHKKTISEKKNLKVGNNIFLDLFSLRAKLHMIMKEPKQIVRVRNTLPRNCVIVPTTDVNEQFPVTVFHYGLRAHFHSMARCILTKTSIVRKCVA